MNETLRTIVKYSLFREVILRIVYIVSIYLMEHSMPVLLCYWWWADMMIYIHFIHLLIFDIHYFIQYMIHCYWLLETLLKHYLYCTFFTILVTLRWFLAFATDAVFHAVYCSVLQNSIDDDVFIVLCILWWCNIHWVRIDTGYAIHRYLHCCVTLSLFPILMPWYLMLLVFDVYSSDVMIIMHRGSVLLRVVCHTDEIIHCYDEYCPILVFWCWFYIVLLVLYLRSNLCAVFSWYTCPCDCRCHSIRCILLFTPWWPDVIHVTFVFIVHC